MKGHPTACTGRLLRRQFLRAVLVACAFLLAESLPVAARASGLSACVQRKVHFDGGTPLNYYRVMGEPDAKLFIYPKYSEACTVGKGNCEPKGAYLVTGNEVAVGKQCGKWSYMQYIGKRRITKGWVESARLQFLRTVKTSIEDVRAIYAKMLPPGPLAPLFRMTRGHGIPVCEAYLQRLNTTDYQAGHVYPQSPFDGIPESDAVPGFVLLHRVMLQPDTIIKISGPLMRWWEEISPNQGGNWDTDLLTIKLAETMAWRYDPLLDINNNGKPVNLIVWRGYGVSGASAQCGEPFNPNYTWGFRCRQLPLVMKDDLHVNYAETAEIFGRVGAEGPDRGDEGEIRHPFIPVGFFISPFVYLGTTYFSTFFSDRGDYEGKRQGEPKLWNSLGVLVRHRGRTQEVCEYQLKGDDYPKADTGLED